MRTSRITGLALITLASMACKSTATDPPSLGTSQEGITFRPPIHLHFKPTYDQVYRKATHNSYWVNVSNGELDDPEASGTQERIVDQMLHEHVRAFELDLHYESLHPGEFTVYHTDDATTNSTCHYVTDCLQLFQRLDYLVPNHEVVNIIFEFKEDIYGPLFGSSETGQNHSMLDLDRQLWEHLGSRIYSPREMLANPACSGMTLRQCVAAVGWPTTESLRGRYIINVIGNWTNNYFDWLSYATDNGGIANRAAFPLRSILSATADWLPALPVSDQTALNAPSPLPGVGEHPFIELSNDGYKVSVPVPLLAPTPNVFPKLQDPAYRTQLQAARDASIFWQVEDDSFTSPSDPRASYNTTNEFFSNLSHGGGRREAASVATQTQIVEGYTLSDGGVVPPAKYQMLQTDYPWSFINDQPTSSGNEAELPTNPARPFFEPADIDSTVARSFLTTDLTEPGYRIYLSAPQGTQTQKAVMSVAPGGTDTWEFQASNGTVTHDTNGPAAQARPASFGYFVAFSSANPEGAYFSVGRVQQSDAGRSVAINVNSVNEGVSNPLSFTVPHQRAQPGDVGDLIRVTATQSGNATSFKVETAGLMNADGTPHWNELPGSPFTIPGVLDMQGLAADGDVLFVGAQHNGAPVQASGLPVQVPANPAGVVDLSYCGSDGSTCASRDMVPRESFTSWDTGTYFKVHEAAGQVFGQQERHLYTNDRNEAQASGLLTFTDTKFLLRGDAPDATWLPVYRCIDPRRDMHVVWLDTLKAGSTLCANSGDDPGQPNGFLGYISTTDKPNMLPLNHLRKGTHNATGSATATDEHDTHDHVFAVGDEAIDLQANNYELRELVGWVYNVQNATTPPCQPKATCAPGTCGAQGDGCGHTITCTTPCASGNVCYEATQTCVASGSLDACYELCDDAFQACLNPPPGTPRQGVTQCSSEQTACKTACNCQPKTCASLGVACGSAADGCGGTLSCGSCSGGATCSSSGQCVAPSSGGAQCRAQCLADDKACIAAGIKASECTTTEHACVAACPP